MSDATDAIIDIVEALEDYGTNISIRRITTSSYDPYLGPDDTFIDTDTKAFITLVASRELSQQFEKHTYDLAIKTYDVNEITKKDKILYDGEIYNILFINSKVLQNSTLIYELLIVR